MDSEQTAEHPRPELSPAKRALIEARLRGLVRASGIVPRAHRDGAPLSFAQERLWFIDRLEPGSAVYNVPVAWRLRGALDGAALERSLSEIVRRHEALRTVFREMNGSPVQTVAPFGGFALPTEDLSALGEADREAALRRRAGEEARRPFDLAAGPPFRAALLRLGAGDHALLLTLHHIVSDGWSMGVLFRELSALYAAYREGRESPLPEPPVQYADYAAWQREQLRGEVLERQVSYWKKRLGDAPALLELPTDHPRPATQSFRGADERIELPGELLEGLRALGRSEGATLYMVVLTVFQVLLSRYGAGEDIVVGSPVAGRSRNEVKELIGFFVNTLVLRTDLSGDPTFRELLGRVREATLGAYEHQELPFERLVAELRPERTLSHSPLFQVAFTLDDAQDAGGGLAGLAVQRIAPELAIAKFDLSLALAAGSDGLRGGLIYGADLWEAATMRRLAGHFARLVEQAAADPDARISQVALLSEAERTRLVEEWSGGCPRSRSCSTVHEAFAGQAARTPDAIALTFGEVSVTYAELDRRSDALARRLAALGVGPETRVGVCVERSPEMVAGLLAVLKAGGAYVPLDPGYPAERLAFMLSDSGARVLLARERLPGRLPEFGGEVVCVDGLLADAEGAPAPILQRPTGVGRTATAENLAYVIYTSGSTGQPKGTEVPHRAIPGFFRDVDYARFDERVVLLQHSSTSWDALTLELWPALLSGGRCVLLPADTSEPALLGEQVRAHGANTLWLTAAYFNLIVDTAPEVLAGVEQVMIGGEAVSAPHVRRALELHPGLRLVNGYGPSECTVFVSCHPVPAGFDAPVVPIGRPVGDRRVYLLDRGFEPVPVGVPGELFVGGPAVARGYLGRPELTAERFVPDPFGEPRSGARLYRSGDRARWRADGTLEFVGRVDFQVKIRGFRVEPGEVEGVLAAHPAVREAVVVVREAAPGERRLVAYATAEEGAELSPASLRAYLADRMPEYMVPAAVMALEAMPLTAHGKIDRRALPDPSFGGEEAAAPRTPTEEVVAGIFAGVLGTGRVGTGDSFFDLGGHSLLATRLAARVRETFGVELPLRTLFEAPTVAGLAARVDALLRAGVGTQAPPVVPVPRDPLRPLPLSFAQQRLWFVEQVEPGTASYIIAVPVRLRGPLDAAALGRALDEIVRRHEALRTVFATLDGEPVQVVRPAARGVLAEVELGALPGEAAGREARRLAAAESLRPFDLERGPLFRATLLRTAPGDAVLLLAMHHAVSDGWSLGVLTRELSALYEAFSRGAPSPLAELPFQYADFATWQRGWLSGETLERQLGWWKARLAGAPPLLELPVDRPRTAVRDTRGGAHPFVLAAETSRALRELSRREGATLFMTLLAAWQLLLSRWSGQEDVVVGSPIAGRTHLELEGLIGFFVNTLPLRTELSGDPTFTELLHRVRESTLGAYQHQDVPFEKLVEELEVPRSLAHSPLFQAVLSLQNVERMEERLGEVRMEPLGSEARTVRFDLTLALREEGEEIHGGLTYRADLWDAETAGRMLEHLRRLLEQAAGEPGRRLSQLEMLGPAERARVLEEWNATAADFPALPVHLRIAEHAARMPGAPAVVFGAETLSFAELEARANGLARRLRAHGVGPDARVGIFLERGPDLVAGVLGILKAGGAYVALDPSYPDERLRFMLEDAGAGAVLTHSALAGRIGGFGGAVECVDAAGHDGAGADPVPPVAPENLAYVVYTSGSTGTPKGVLVTHRGLSNYLAFFDREILGDEGFTLPLVSRLSFDAHVRQLYPPLLRGEPVWVLPEETVEDPVAILEVLGSRERVSFGGVPSLWGAVLEAVEAGERPAPRGLRAVLLGGEALPGELVRRTRAAFPDAAVWNHYGPTEATVNTTVARVDDPERVVLGRPVANVRVYLLDAHGNPVPVGVAGELHVGGTGVARGYLGRPELTAEKFLPDPFTGEAGARMYRSGDRARRLSTGELEYLGRTDHQVKVRGFRVEPGEIGAALARHPGVREAVVVLRGGALVGYVVPAEGGTPPPAAELRAWLGGRLPEHMVPASFVVLERLPLTANGKVDRAALPEPGPGGEGERYAAPRTPTEEVVAGIFGRVLGVERVGREDDFFALGGHSLVATRVVSRVRQSLGVELPLRVVFEAPVVAALAARVDALLREGAGTLVPPVVPVPRDPRSPLPLSFAQQRLWFFDRLDPGSTTYNLPLALRLRGALDPEVLERTVTEIVRRHEALRTVFDEVDGGPVQVVRPAGPVPLPATDLSGLPGESREAEARRVVGGTARRAFDLRRGPLFYARLFRLAAEDHVLVLAMHHVVGDGWSTGVLLRELASLYEAFGRGEPSPLPEPQVQYADFAVWQRGWLAGPTLERQLSWWREALEGAPAVLEVPVDHPRRAAPGDRGAIVSRVLPRKAAERLRALARDEGATLYMVALASLGVLLARWSGKDDVVVGTPIANRTRHEVEGLIGFFVNTLALRTDVSGNPTFRELLGRVRETTLGAYQHQDVPFEKLVEELRVERTLSHTPLFQVMLSVDERPAAPGFFSRIRAEPFFAVHPVVKFDLGVDVVSREDGLGVSIAYRAELWDPATMERVLGSFALLLEAAAADPGRRIQELPLATRAEQDRVLREWSAGPDAPRRAACLHELFREQAARTPEAPAVVAGDGVLTYRELDARADRLARRLAGLGAGPEVRVGVCLERSTEMVVAILAVLKAGAAYLPLDPAYPADRLAYMLADSGARVLVTRASLRGLLPAEGVRTVLLDAGPTEVAAEPDGAPPSAAAPENAVYVIYTSGSTGRPKGVVVTHGNAANLLPSAVRTFGAEPGGAVLQTASMSFDASLLEVFVALLSGAALHVADRETVLAPERLAALLRERRIEVWVSTPALLDSLPETDFPALRTISTGGERCPAETAARWSRGRRLVNMYGPTEATIYTTAHACAPGVAEAPPIGRPVEGARVYVLDAWGEPAPVGVPGELYVGGAGVARGYLGRPALTAEMFVPDPFAGEGGARTYRTGDRVRWLASGELEYLGRLDEQVKVRGIRIELGEIEGALRRCGGVADCVVVAREDAPGEKRLVAYVVGGVEAGLLREQLRRELPEYMVPAAFVFLDALPLTPGGKLDRRALPASDFAAAEDRYVAPRTPTEETLVGIWAEILRVERVGVEDGFFELGGHSLLATRVISRVRERFGVEVPLRALFEGATVTELAARVEASRRVELPAPPPAAPAAAAEPAEGLPLSFAQERLWFIDRMEPGSAVYNLPVAWRLKGALDAAALERSLSEIVRRHEALRTVFAEVDGSPVQVIVPAGGFALAQENLSDMGEADREAALRRRAAEEARRPFDLVAGPLFRAALLRLGAEEHALLLCMHHIVSDGWSMGVLRRELSALYAAYRQGGESPLPELEVQYADYAMWQREQLAGEALDRQLGYWRKRLANAPALLELPTDHPRPAAQSFRGATERVQLPPEVLERLRALARRERATLYMVLLGAFQTLLGRYGGSDDVVVGSPVAGRGLSEVEGLIGFFVNTLVLRTDLSGDPSFRELLGRVHEVTLGAYEHQEIPFERLVAELRPERSLSHSPLFQAAFTLDNAQDAGGGLAGLSVQAIAAELDVAKFDLSLALAVGSEGLRGGLTYSTDLWEAATMRRLVGHFTRLVERAAADPDVRISRVALLDEAERRQVVEEWSRTPVESPTTASIHALFLEQAARTPDALAVVSGGDALTYAELDTRADRLARRLAGLGAGPEVRVGVCLERSAEMVVAILAVLKAGAAYLPLDPAYPADRLAYMLADSGARVLVTRASLRGLLPADGVRTVLLDAEEAAAGPHAAPMAAASPENAAYVIYTSGSTGRPKGVVVTHGNAANLLPRAVKTFGAEPGGAVLQTASMSFDASLLEVFVALLSGAALHVADRETVLAPERLAALLRERRIEVWVSTPALLDSLAETDFPALRTISTGGERCPAETAARWSRGRRLVNMYGPTEATIYTTAHACAPGVAEAPPIGRPVEGARVYVLDAWGEPAPVGVPGELYVGGAGVARGYLDRPALTAEMFVPDPFAGEGGARTYRTGDRARWLASGELEYLGRLDEQVKVRGIRIELGEIEGALRRCGGVADCVVVAREDAPGEKRLVAYVVGGVEAGLLREQLRRELPEYMVPAAFVFLDALPLTPGGKLDRRALPASDFAAAEDRYVAPRTPTEEVLAGIWAETLGLERAGVTESFFELGGHSLLAARVVSRVRERFGVEVPVRALFEGPTVAELAGRVEEIQRAEARALPPVVPVDRTGPLPLSFAQERLWLVDQMEPGSAVYNVPVAWRLGGALDEAALERALGEIVRRHEALRTTFAEVDGSPVQVIAPFGGFALPTENLSELGEADREAALGRRAGEEARRPFDLSAGPLFRAALLRLGEEDHVLLLTMHHIVSDGWSMGVLFRELSALYAAYREGGESPLPELGVQYADHAVWQREQLAGEVLDRQLAYWRERLAGAPELLELPVDHPRPAVQTYRGATVPIDLSQELLERLQALGRTEGATLFMVLLSAFQVLLSRYSGSEDVVVGSPIAGRTRGEVEGLIGFFVNTLVLRVDLSGDPSLRELLGRVREVTLGAYEHQELPFEKLVGELSPERSLSHSPLFQVSFTLETAQDTGGGLAGLGVQGVAAELAVAKFDLSLGLAATTRGLRGGLNYSTDLFERGSIERMARQLERVLEQVARDADLRLSELRLAGEEERALLAAGHATRSFPVAERLDQRFEARVLERPHAPALTFEGSTLTYRELNERANRLAHRLRALGVAPGTRVGIALERSAELVAAILAVLKAGAAYVPLDPAYPAERIAFVLEDAEIPVLVTASGLLARLSAFTGAALCVDTDPEAIAAESAENPRVEAGPDTLAYVIYTSGSTGRPKGVQVTHANVVRLFDATDPWFGFAPDDVWTLFHSCAFDFSVWEIWGALLHGGRLVVVPFLTTRSPEDFHRLLAAEGVTMLSQTPSAFKQLVQADLASGVDPSLLRLRHVVFGGEALDPQALKPWIERYGDEQPRLVNMYGITETTVHVTYRAITRADLDRAGSPIGVPIPDLALYVLDSRLEPVPIGVPGEIFVGGAGVARGYLNRPELTAERFLRDPFSADPAARLYRSGDLARWRADGELEYLGRADQQVKVRGFRIEPGEVEAALLELPGIRDAAVLVREDARGDKQLVAYVVLRPGEAEDPTALRAALSGRLPEYMVPAAFVVLPGMPLTPNGKLDRRALPAPGAGRTLRPAYASPASAAERLLQEVWQEVLGVERVGVLENFFAAGGDSMRAVQMVAALRRRGMALTVRDLFEEPTIRALAQRTDAAARADAAPGGGVPHHLADLPEEEWSRVRAVFPEPFQDVYPASRMQAVMLAEYARDAARTGVYHPQQCHRLTDPALSTDALRHAIGQVVRRHAIFRTVFATGRDGALLQVVRESPSVPIGYRDLRGLSSEEQERAVRAGVAEDLATPFDPFDPGGSLIRFVIFHREEHVADLLISAHHAIEDGWGNVHFLGTLFQAYADARDGRPVSAAPVPNTYREFVALEAEILASDEARTFWRDRMRHVSAPWPAPRGAAGRSPRESLVVREAAPELTAALRETAAREGVALKALYLSSFLDVVATLTGGEDACTGVVWNGRSERLSDPLTALGLFWNLLPVARPATASGGAVGRALAVHRDLLQADLFGRYPLAEIVAERGWREPFFSTFNFLHFRNWAKRDAARGARVEPVYGLDRLHLPFNLAVSLAPSGEGAKLLVEYDSRFFGRVDVAAALESYLLRLEEMTS